MKEIPTELVIECCKEIDFHERNGRWREDKLPQCIAQAIDYMKSTLDTVDWAQEVVRRIHKEAVKLVAERM